MKRFLALFYGALIFISYFLIKAIAKDQYALYFMYSCACLSVLLIPFLKAPFPKPFAGVLLRGLMYATTNFLLLAAQSTGTVSSSLAAGLVGSMCVSIPQLVRPVRVKNTIIILFLAIGIGFLFEQIKISYLALFSGIIQAITFASASRVMRVHQISISWNLYIGFLMVFVSGFCLSFFFDFNGSFHDLQLLPLCGVSIILICSQVAFFQLYRNFPIETASRFSLGRIPWSFFIESFFFGKTCTVQTAIGAVFLSFASFMKKERKDSRR